MIVSSDTARVGDDRSDETARAKRSRWRWLAAGVVVGLVGLGIRGWLHQQPYNSDDIQYFTQAREMALPSISDLRIDEPRSGLSPNSLRFVFLGVPAATAAILGDGADAFYAAVYTIAALSFVGVFFFAWVMTGPRVAVITAAIWATSYVAIAVDTRLVPDNMGTALGLIGLGLIAFASGLGRKSGVEPPASVRRRIVYAVIGGFLLWAAFSTRASFFVFALAGVVFAMLGERRWTIVIAVIAGGLLGQLVELVYFAAVFGDPLVRWRALLGFGSSMASMEVGVNSAYAGYSTGDLFTRYPLILRKTDSAEIWLHFVGLGVFVWWALGWREPYRLAKAICGFLFYGFLTFAITSVDPVVPLMREKIRYYATVAPVFYLAVGELLGFVLFSRARLAGVPEWLSGRPRVVAAAALVFFAIVANLAMGADSPQFAKNGNDALLTAAEVLAADASVTGRPRVLYNDMRTSRVMSLLLPAEDGWSRASGYDSLRSMDFAVAEDGYLLLNWKRLNANVRNRYVHGPRTHNYYRIIEHHPLVGRHRRGGELVDLFFVSRDEITREIAAIDDAFPLGWSRVRRGGPPSELPVGEDIVFADTGKSREYIYSGVGRPSRPPKGTRLSGETFFQARIVADARRMTRLRAYLFWWRDGNPRVVRQYMGTVWVGPEAREYALWTYLPQDARSHRLVLRGDAGLRISRVSTRRLGIHRDDRIRQFGGAWPKVAFDVATTTAAKRIRDDALTNNRARRIYDEPPAGRVVKLMPKEESWSLAPRSARQLPPGSYLVLSWDRLRDDAFGTTFEEARVHRYYRVLADTLLVHRYRGDRGFVDVFFVPEEPISRPVISEVQSFPRGWTRLLNSTKTWEPLDIRRPVAFASDDPNDEYIYSGAGPVWRATTEETSIEGRQFFQVLVDAEAETQTPLRAALFWWPEGEKEPRRQSMGKVVVGPTTRQFALWTYLPARATSHRLVLRSKSGVAISNVRARVLGRLEGDHVEQHGGAW